MVALEQSFLDGLRHKTGVWLNREGKSFAFSNHVAQAPDLFHLLCKVSLDEQVPDAEKAVLVGAIVYFITPLDVIPEGVEGPAGLVDDVALAAYALDKVQSATSPEVLQRYWSGEGEIREILTFILSDANQMLGCGRWDKLKTLLR